MKSKYAVCLVFTKDMPGLLRIETIMFHGKIRHPRLIKAEKVFDQEKAVEDSLKQKESIKLLKDGFVFFLANHVIL